jgi:hypothetical protein
MPSPPLVPGKTRRRADGSRYERGRGPSGGARRWRPRRLKVPIGRTARADRADAGAVPYWPADGVAGHDQPAEGDAQAPAAMPRCVRSDYRATARVVRCRTVGSRELFARSQAAQPGVYPSGAADAFPEPMLPTDRRQLYAVSLGDRSRKATLVAGSSRYPDPRPWSRRIPLDIE